MGAAADRYFTVTYAARLPTAQGLAGRLELVGATSVATLAFSARAPTESRPQNLPLSWKTSALPFMRFLTASSCDHLKVRSISVFSPNFAACWMSGPSATERPRRRFGGTQQVQDRAVEMARQGPSRLAFGAHLRMRTASEPGHADQRGQDGLQRQAVFLDRSRPLQVRHSRCVTGDCAGGAEGCG